MKILAKADDQELIRAFRQGNDGAFQVLMNRHKSQLYYVIFCLVRDNHTAEDMLQEVFFKIIKSIKDDQYNEEGRFLPWASRIASNLCLDYLRKVKRRPRLVSDEKAAIKAMPAEEGFEHKMISLQTNTHLNEALDYLPEDQRKVIFFRHFEEMSFKDIALVTNTSVSTAIGRMRYGLINLRKIIDQKQALFCR
jgi:RNA polymerase sigma factor (sigma-70 family)